MVELILASASPRRASLLEQVGIPFKVIPAAVRETPPGKPPAEAVQELALRKARQVASRVEKGLVLGADTLVVHRGEILGKPRSAAEARQMLRHLSGDRHSVFTGLALVDAGGESLTSVAETVVWMRTLEEELIEAYVATGEPMDKAGAYGIQGKAAFFVERIEGCYFNVMGLPLSRLFLLLARMGIEPWAGWRENGYAR